MPSTSDNIRRPRNLGRLIGPKPPFKSKHIWAIRTRLQYEGRTGDLALFNTAIDNKLRGCDLVRLRVADVHFGDGVRLRTAIVQQNTGRPLQFELTETTRETLTAWLKLRGLRAGDWPFPSRSRPGDHLTSRKYGQLADEWVALIGLDPARYGIRAAASDRKRPRPIHHRRRLTGRICAMRSCLFIRNPRTIGPKQLVALVEFEHSLTFSQFRAGV